MKRWNSNIKILLSGAVAATLMASGAQANRWFEPTPIDAPSAALAASDTIQLAQSQKAKTPAQLALEEANQSSSKKKKKKKRKKKRRGSFR